MKKRLQMWLLFAVLLLVAPGVSSQTKVLEEGFESGIPATWSQSPATGVDGWTTGSSGVYTLTPESGSAYAQLYTSNQQAPVMLISPMVSIGNLADPVLSFWYANPSFQNGDVDTLKAYYRTSATGAWEELFVSTTPMLAWTRVSVSLLGIQSTQIQIGFEYVYGAGRGIALDNMFVGNAPVCTQPTDLAAFRISSVGAELFWNAHEQSMQYDLKVSTTTITDFNATADVFDGVVYYKPYPVTGLSPQTTYYYAVRANCGDGDESEWSSVGQFTTACAPATLPLTEAFDTYGTGTGTFPTCWTKLMNFSGDWGTAVPGTTYTPYLYATYKHSGVASLCLSAYYYSSTSYTSPRITKCVAATQELNVADITSTQVTFWAYSAALANKIYVGVMSDPSDISTFEEIAMVQVSKISTWEEFIIPFTSSTNGGKYVAFQVDAADRLATTTVYVDDVVVETIPPCPKPSLVRIHGVGSTDVTVGWSSSNSSSWNVKVSTTAMTDFTATADGFDGVVSSNPAQITGLTPQTDYYVYVQSDCATDGTSAWSNVLQFKTQCAAVTTFPYTENFDALTVNGFPDCWTKLNTYVSSSVEYPAVKAEQTSSAPNSLKFISPIGTPEYAITPAIASTMNSLTLSFSLRASSITSSGVMEVGVMTNPYDTATFTLVRSIQPTSTVHTAYQIHLLNVTVPGENNHIAFRHRTKSASYYYWLDDVVIDSLPTCIAPMDMQSRNITSDAATMYWTPVLGESQWNIKVSTTVLTDPETAIGNVFNGTASVDSIRLNNLVMGKTYYVYIQSDCGNETSTWEMASFTTACGPITNLPFVENFTDWGTGTGVMPGCWKAIPTAYPYISSSYNNTAGEAGGTLYFYPSTTNPKTFAVLPEFAVAGKTVQDAQVSFCYRAATVGYAIVVGVMNSQTDTASFVPVDTFAVTTVNTWFDAYDVDFSSYTGTGKYIAFLSQIGFSSTSYNTMYMDNINVELIPTCKTPLDVAKTTVLDTEFSIAWTPRGTEGSWDIAFGPVGFDPDTATLISVTQPNYTFTGLTASTPYQVYVRSDCGVVDGVSLWSRVLSVTTSATPEELPLITGFEDAADNAKWTILNGTQTNKWVIGTGTNNGGTKAMYISNSTGTNAAYAYTTSSAVSYSWAYRTLRFNPGIYQISFDWKCQGESTWDLGRCFLVDPSVELEAANAFGMTGTTNTDPAGWIAVDGVKMNLDSTWKKKEYLLILTEPKIYNLTFFWKNDGSGGTQPPFAFDNLVVEALSCAPASDFTYDAMSDSISLTWPNLVGSTVWDVKVSTTALDMNSMATEVGDVYNDTVRSNHVMVGGLTPNTPYYFYVRTHCPDGSLEDWSRIDIRTECVAINQLPYKEGFDTYGTGTAAVIPCWTRAQPYTSGTTNYPYINSSQNHTPGGAGSLYFYTTSTSTVFNVMASPRITADSIKNLRVGFYAYYSSTGHYIEVGAMTDPNDPATFVPVDTLTIATASTWHYLQADMSSYTGNGEYIGFRTGGRTSYNYIYLDDIEIVDNRSCIQPDELSVTRITSDGAKLNWSSSNALALYNLKLSTTPINPLTETADVMELEGLQDGYITLNGLDANTTYYFYVQADCGDPVMSYWSDGCSFTTMCLPQAVPYVENFNTRGSGVGVIPECWSFTLETVGAVTGNYNSYIYKGVYYGADSMSLRMASYYSKTTSGENVTIKSVKSIASLPLLTGNLDALYISFRNYSANAGRILSVGVMTDVADPSTFEMVDTIVLGAWQQSMVSFENYQGPAGYISFMIDGQYDAASTTAYIDGIKVDSLKGCLVPMMLDARDITATGAEIYWNSLTAADTLFRVQVSTFDAKYNVYQLDTITSFVKDTIVSGRSVVIDGLNSTTTYYYYVRPICSDTIEGPRYPSAKSFRTGCGKVSLPYSESFDNAGTGTGKMAECWTAKSSYNSTYPYISTTNYSAPGSVYFYSTATTYTYAVTPEIDIDSLKRAQVTFMGRTTSTAYNLKIGVMTDPEDYSTFDSLTTITLSATSTWFEITYNFTNYTGDGKYVAFVADKRYANLVNYFYLDDVIVQLQPTCIRPGVLTASGMTQTTATLNWVASSTGSETDYDVAIVPYGGNVEDATPVTVTGRTYAVTGLQHSSTYQAYVRSNCGAGDVSAWRGPVTFSTLQIAATLPFVSTFDAANEGWTFENGTQTNQFAIGNAASHTGTGALYISNDNGASHAYTITATSAVYAYRLIDFTPGVYKVRFNWMGQGESTLDYGRVYLAPNTATFVAGTNVMTSTGTAAPTGWMPLDGIKLNLMSTWQTVENTFTITETTSYYVVVGWRCNASAGTQPPFAIDNLSIEAVPCFTPVLSADSILDTRAYMNWYADGDSVMAKLSTVSIPTASLDTTTADLFDGILTTTSISATGLTPSTRYYVYVRAFCHNGDTTAWTGGYFDTECGAVTVNDTTNYAESFDTYGTPASATRIPCWKQLTNYTTAYPYLTSTNFSAPASLYFYGSTTYYSAAVSPRVEGKPMNELQVRFKGRSTSLTYYLLVGVMSDPNDVSTFVKMDSLLVTATSTWQDFIVPFSGYTGNGKHVAFKVGNKATSYFYVDDVVIEAIPDCSAPTRITASNITQTSLTFDWNYLPTDTAWEVKVYAGAVDVTLPGDVLDTLVNTPLINVSGLSASSTYSIVVRKKCTPTEYSAWSAVATGTTACGIIVPPYTQNFSGGVVPPSCWSRYTGALGSTLTSTTGGWGVNTLYGLQGPHAKLNIYSTSRYYWLVTPQVSISAPTVVSFDLALTDYNNNDPIEDASAQADDRFIVVMSTDNGATWDQTNMVVWNDVTGDYGFSSIPTNGTRYSVNLSHYVGQNVLIGFYGESTASGGDNDLHLGNISINEVQSVSVTGEVCAGYPYAGNGFNISASEVATAGNYTFSRVGRNLVTEVDTVIMLNLTVNPNVVNTINAEICSGDVYTLNGFNASTTGTFRRNLVAASGCDSTVILNLTVKGGAVGATDRVQRCQSDMPYTWRGTSYTTGGQYYDTLVSASGCDSIVSLILTVMPEHNVTDQHTIMETDLPFNYMDTVFGTDTKRGVTTHVLKRQTAAGCDSIVTLTLTVLTVGLNNVTDGYFEIYPNPAQREQLITLNANFTEAELEGMVVEVFNSVGECVKTMKPAALPIQFSGFDSSGVYLVRVTTASGRVVYGKVVVR